MPMSSPSITPLNSQSASAAAPSSWQKAKNALGFVWTTLGQIPHGIVSLIVKIKNLASGILSSSQPDSQPSILQSKTITPAEKPQVSDEEPDLGLQLLYQTDSNVQDPFWNMGAVRPPENQLSIKVDSVPVQIKVDSEPQVISKDLMTARELVQRAQQLLQEDRNPLSLGEFVGYTDFLNQQFKPLHKYASTFEKSSPEDHKLVQTTIAALEKKVKEWENQICLQVALFYSPNPYIPNDGNCLFWSISNLDAKGYDQKHYRQKAADYLRLHAAQDETAINEILYIMGLYKPVSNTETKLDQYAREQGGWEQWKTHVKQKLSLEHEPTNDDLYRDFLINRPIPQKQTVEEKIKLYAESQGGMEKWKAKIKESTGQEPDIQDLQLDFLLNNPQMAEEEIDKVDEYAAARGGWARWMAEFKEKDPLKQEPTIVDLYCDFLVNSSQQNEQGKEIGHPLWGDLIEAMALSQQLKVPILIFQPSNSSQKEWQFYAKIGVEFIDQEPLLLYYSGKSHYQSLIPKS